VKTLHNSYGWKRSKEEIKKAFDARIEKAVDSLPPRFFDRVHEIVRHKLTLPARLIQVRPIGKRVMRECDMKKVPQVYEAVYKVVAEVLETYGGVLSEFESHRHSGSRVYDNPAYRRIYRFPPLEER
jgi:hypothetical protein